MNNINVVNSLKLMGMGMAAIFFVIIIIYLALELILKFANEKSKK